MTDAPIPDAPWRPKHKAGIGWVAVRALPDGANGARRQLAFRDTAGETLLWAVKSEAQAWCDSLNRRADTDRLDEAVSIRQFLETAEHMIGVLGRVRARKFVLEVWSILA